MIVISKKGERWKVNLHGFQWGLPQRYLSATPHKPNTHEELRSWIHFFGYSCKYIYDRLLSYCPHLEEIFVDSHILFHRVVGSKSVRQYIGFGCQEVHVEEHHMLVWHTPARCLIISDNKVRFDNTNSSITSIILQWKSIHFHALQYVYSFTLISFLTFPLPKNTEN